MKIRTITTGFNLKIPFSERQLKSVASATIRLKKIFEGMGYSVQTVRLATQPWESWGVPAKEMGPLVEALESTSVGLGIDYLSLGTTFHSENIPRLLEWLAQSRSVFFTATAGDRKGANHAAAAACAALIKKLALPEKEGFANLRFAALFNTPPGSPFFPAAYHRGSRKFALGLENSDLVVKAFSKAGNIQGATAALRGVMAPACRKLERAARLAAREVPFAYGGIDVSIAPAAARDESLAFAIESLGLGRFGEAGTLAASKAITDTLRALPVSRCGYSGLMMPILEDTGLALRNSEARFNLGNLMAFSAVCGTGLDTIPLPGDVPEKTLYALLLDLAALSARLDKPLSARLMPIPGRRAGDKTSFDFDYFVNTRVMPA